MAVRAASKDDNVPGALTAMDTVHPHLRFSTMPVAQRVYPRGPESPAPPNSTGQRQQPDPSKLAPFDEMPRYLGNTAVIERCTRGGIELRTMK